MIRYIKIYIAMILSILLGSIYSNEAVAQEKENADFGSLMSAVYASYSTANELKLVSETTGTGENYVGYAYVELGSTPFLKSNFNWAYTQIFWEQKFWETPLFLHAEYRTFLSENYYDNIFYLGAAYTFGFKNGYLAIEPLYRFNLIQGHGAQLSIVGGWDWKHLNLAHFTDIYSGHNMPTFCSMYNECRLFYKVCRHFEVGAVGILAYSFQSRLDAVSLALALKINL